MGSVLFLSYAYACVRCLFGPEFDAFDFVERVRNKSELIALTDIKCFNIE